MSDLTAAIEDKLQQKKAVRNCNNLNLRFNADISFLVLFSRDMASQGTDPPDLNDWVKLLLQLRAIAGFSDLERCA